MSAETVTEATGKALAKNESGGRALVSQYAADFRQVMPSHIRGDQWIRLAQGALKKGKKVRGPNGESMTELELAAVSAPGVFLAHLLNAARLGLEPGTEQYYLTPRKVKGGGLEILGIVGYQGYIELMYRAGAISSVVAECVYSRDSFRFRPGVDERPVHEIDWDADDRGELRLVYAYASMKDGATSKVVVLNKAAIATIKASATGANSEHSPWQKHPASMWLKSAVRQLAKWVPTSAEYVREQLRAQRDVSNELTAPVNVTDLPEVPLDGDDFAIERNETDDNTVVDAEIVDDEQAWAADAQREQEQS